MKKKKYENHLMWLKANVRLMIFTYYHKGFYYYYCYYFLLFNMHFSPLFVYMGRCLILLTVGVDDLIGFSNCNYSTILNDFISYGFLLNVSWIMFHINHFTIISASGPNLPALLYSMSTFVPLNPRPLHDA